MATSISNGESGLSVRTKLNDIWHSLDLNEYNKEILDTAVDVFVYDTSKDSDGGAWRKRTQGTSWYNETLNTATRGSRKEFPAVAVIVAESDTVTIYDGDDPDLPMWKQLVSSSTSNGAGIMRIGGGSYPVTTVSMLNATLVIGKTASSTTYNAGVDIFSFIEDVAYHRSDTVNVNGFVTPLIDYVDTDFTPELYPVLVNSIVNDVAMTVLPNAPIDAATGLPVPTIAIASDGGVSVIKDDGTVVDLKTTNTYTGANKIEFTKENKLAFSAQNSGGQQQYYNYVVDSIPSSDETFSNWRGNSERVYETLVGTLAYSAVVLNPITYTNSGANVIDATPTDYGLAAGFNSRLTAILETSEINNENAGAYITSTYNTGWMNGDIKLATLSDTDDTDVTGSELVTNGTFDSDVSGWTVTSNGTFTYSSGSAILEQVTGSNASVYQSITTVVGKRYVASCDVTGITSRILIGTSASSGNIGASGFLSNTTIALDFVATSTTTFFSLQGGGTVSGQQTTVDNISVRLAEEDRSVNGNGLQVFGTVTKDPVATGADLVAYSGWSDSNYLMQPYNSDLDFGTGDFCIMGWQKGTDTIGPFLTRNSNNANHLFTVGSYTTDKVWFSTGDSSGNKTTIQTDITTPSIDADVWNCWCFIRRNGVLEVWLGGVLQGTKSGTVRDVSSTDAVLYVATDGPSSSYGGVYTGSLALWRISATAPSPEQIKKIYEDEKVLFQDNTQATLYGSSDAVTALAYDDTTELLHVGTSAGRSVFQGLRRVDNTTTAVSAAISASNNLVGEQ